VNIGTDTFTKAAFNFVYHGKNKVGFENLSTGSNMTYNWYFGDGDSSTLKDPVHQYINANNQTVRLVVSGSCGDDDTTIQLRDFTSLTPFSRPAQFHIYPNPSGEYLSVIGSDSKQVLMEIADMTGKVLVLKWIHIGEKLETSALPDGVYIAKIYSGQTIETSRLLILHN
jgi:hypothetical protein